MNLTKRSILFQSIINDKILYFVIPIFENKVVEILFYSLYIVCRWVRLIARMFEAMAGNFTSSRDIHLFLNVLNGALMLHSEDSLILRYVIATYVNAAFNFKSIFSTNG